MNESINYLFPTILNLKNKNSLKMAHQEFVVVHKCNTSQVNVDDSFTFIDKKSIVTYY